MVVSSVPFQCFSNAPQQRSIALYLAVVQVDHQLANVRLNSFAITPPLLEIVRYGIAGGSALAEADG